MQDLFTYQNNFLDDLINYYVTNVENYNDWSSWEDDRHMNRNYFSKLSIYLLKRDLGMDYKLNKQEY